MNLSSAVRDRPREPRTEDAVLAGAVAARIHAADPHRVRRVFMIGSRARGTPRPDSDLDLVVVVEWPEPGRRWQADDAERERARIIAAVPPPPVRTDLWVRSTDRFEEARSVPGGVEWLADREGVEVLSLPYARAALVHTQPAQVRAEMVSSWMHHAIAALEAARGSHDSEAAQARWAALGVERALTALAVQHGRWPDTGATMDARLGILPDAESSLARRVKELLRGVPACPATSAAVTRLVCRRLCEDSATAAVLRQARARLAAIR